ncbi:MAG: hypothetical protein IIT48_07055 [Lachnospiraceae bacterium]|nr:hypothetical protein [Lachnospiraceae bacterium]
MIVGNPDKFAIMLDVVDEWNIDDSFNNGIMIFWINAIMFPQELESVTLNSDFRWFYQSIQNIVENETIFDMETIDAFKSMYRLVYPENYDEDNDYRFQISPQEFNDHHNLVFAVSNGKDIRILASSLAYDFEESTCILENIDIKETFINNGYLKKMIDDIENGEMKKLI